MANIHERGAAIPNCFTGSNGEKICLGDSVGDIQSTGEQLSDWEAYDLATRHLNSADYNGDKVLTSNEVSDPYKTMIEAIDYHTNYDG